VNFYRFSVGSYARAIRGNLFIDGGRGAKRHGAPLTLLAFADVVPWDDLAAAPGSVGSPERISQ